MLITKNINNIILLKALSDGNQRLVNKLLIYKNVIDNLDYTNLKGENALLLCLHLKFHDMSLKILNYNKIGIEQIDHLLL